MSTAIHSTEVAASYVWQANRPAARDLPVIGGFRRVVVLSSVAGATHVSESGR
ncbi:hypothetical protein [Micromonospora sp. NBC_01638]|uniref:hypothetical protein n=1 Tax=Micromonospora sp. NBC_01638 TaxID=2975982 RepID=UPI00386CAA49|nr:hypothetical protein OG811_23925 [Micromonospora sp. NBC_01638]